MPNPHRYALILAGGRGTRFWPRSRRHFAKQVLNVVGERSLIQATLERLKPLISPERMWVLTSEALRREVLRQLPEVPARQVLAEPAQRNTAAAIALTAQILSASDPEAVMGVFPSDHVIARAPRYRQLVRAAFDAAGKGKIAVLGIRPRWPETGYGYIEFPRGTEAGTGKPVEVLSFREKPDVVRARQYLASGNFFWNAGMFFWRVPVLLEAVRKHLPKTATLLASLPAFSDRRFSAQLKKVFPLCEDISIDYAVLERAAGVVGVACDEIGWNDVGSWNAVYELLPRDPEGNCRSGDVLCHDARGNYVDARGKFVALLGVSNLVVVDTPDALLVADRSQAQRVGEIVKLLERHQREELL
ncbi:MAG: mannose-1-phosphate guanylyltransferase [Acidobacteria bacterium]|nr:mannose-1-phosphate guanylyltransferase [Acidobacteriota bacterium]